MKKQKKSRYNRFRQICKNKPRKILNLEERVQAIQMYDSNPVYQRVAEAFGCSWEQIKNIVQNRDAILQYYAQCQLVSNSDNPRTARQKKLNFLGKVMYEYIKRAYYHQTGVLDDEVIRQRAIVFRNILEIENFFPNKTWISDFKQAYNLDFSDLSKMVMPQEPPTSINCQDIIAHCNKELERTTQKGSNIEITATDTDTTSAAVSNERQIRQAATLARQSINLDYENERVADDAVLNTQTIATIEHNEDKDSVDSELDSNSNDDEEMVDICYEVDDDDDYVNDNDVDDEYINECEEGPTIDFGDSDCADDFDEEDEKALKPPTAQRKLTTPKPKYTELTLQEADNVRSEVNSAKSELAVKCVTPPSANYADDIAQSTMVDGKRERVEGYTNAMDVLGPLEEFALEEEDFPAINLISQLRLVYQKALKRKEKSDFVEARSEKSV